MSAPSLWRDRNFNILWFGQVLSGTGDAFSSVALPLLVYRATGSIQGMALVTACGTAGGLLSGVVAGVIVDRFSRRSVMIWTDVVRALLTGAVPLLSALHVLSITVLCGVTFCIGFLSNLFYVSFAAFVAESVSKARVVEANARVNASVGVTFVVGPALAGIAVERWGADVAIGADALSFIASFVSLLMIRGAPPRPLQRQTTERFVGLRFLMSTRALVLITSMLLIERFFTAAALDLFIFNVKTVIGQRDAGVGLMFGLAGLGAVVGAFFLPVLKSRLGTHAVLVVTAVMLAVAFAMAALVQTAAAACGVAALFTFAATIRRVLSNIGFQQLTPDPLLGRVVATFWLILDISRSCGALSMGFVAQHYGCNTAFVIIAVAMAGLAIFTLPARELRVVDA